MATHPPYHVARYGSLKGDLPLACTFLMLVLTFSTFGKSAVAFVHARLKLSGLN